MDKMKILCNVIKMALCILVIAACNSKPASAVTAKQGVAVATSAPVVVPEIVVPKANPIVRHASVTKKANKFEKSIMLGTSDFSTARTNDGEMLNMLFFSAITGFGKDDGSYMLSIRRSGEEWKYLSCYDLILLADGEPYKVKTERNGDVKMGGVDETIIGTLDPVSFAKIAWSKKVEAQLCRSQFTLDDDALQRMRALESDRRDPLPAVE